MGAGNVPALARRGRASMVNSATSVTKVAIDASSATAGGGITYLRQLLPRLAKEPGLQIGPILVRESTVSKLGLSEANLNFHSTPSRLGARARSWRRVVRGFDPDVIFAPTEISFARYDVPLVLAVRYPGFPRAHVREYSAIERSRFALQRVLARASARNAAAHIAVSGHAAAVAAKELGVPHHQLRVVYHGGPEESLPMKTGPARNFLFVSNLYRYKNVIRLVEAFSALSTGTLRIVGRPMENRLQEELDNLVASPTRGSVIQVEGPLHGEQLNDAYGWADCFLWPPYAETFGHPLLEAHSFGLPIIAARVSSNEEIAGEAAKYFDPFDTAELGALIEVALSTGIEARELPRTYSWGICSSETAQVLIEVATKPVYW